MKSILILCLILSFACSSTKDSQNTGLKKSEISTNGKSYPNLVSSAIVNPEKAAYNEIRMSYTKTSEYSPYRSPAVIEDMIKLLNANKNEEVIKLTKANIQNYFAELDFHYYAIAAYKNLKNENGYNWHRYVLNRLIDSIYDSGDGKSPKTAFVVIAVREEYSFMGLTGTENGSQSLIQQDGHSYDMFEVTKSETYKGKKIYFNIDIPFGALSKELRL
jgi:hypothetical protein